MAGVWAESVEVQGLDKLYDRLMTADAKKIKPVLRKGLRFAAKGLLAEARSRTPVAGKLSSYMVGRGYAPGDLRQSLQVRAAPGRNRGTVGVAVVTSGELHMFKGKTFYGGMVHYGTKFQDPQPWIREAFDAMKSRMLGDIQAGLTKELDRLGV
jgi:HK97 gp10 family phage protein